MLSQSAWIASLLAVLGGCAVAFCAGYGPSSWGRNLAAWCIGFLLALTLRRIRPQHLDNAALVLAPLFLLCCFIHPGLAGVHRWVSLGPLIWNVSFLVLPATLVALSRTNSKWAWPLTCVFALELSMQPDASQSAAFSAAALYIAWRSSLSKRSRLVLTGLLLVAFMAVLSFPDPLQPVPEVEGIIGLAYRLSPLAAFLCIAALFTACLAPLSFQPPAIALTLYFLICAIMPLFGAFPVPLVGMGMSPILGYCLGIAALQTANVKSADLLGRFRHY